MIRNYVGEKRSIEARSDDRGSTWKGKLFDAGRMTEFSRATLAEVDALAAKHGMHFVPRPKR
jgi:hypothetical protein